MPPKKPKEEEFIGPKEPPIRSFLRNIENQTIVWRFSLTGGKTVTGRIVDFLWDDRGIPIVLLIKALNNRAIEIPWIAIQTIEEPE